MTEASFRLAFACLCSFLVACSSTPSQKDSGFEPVEVPPGRGTDSIVTPSDGGDAADVAKPADGAGEAGDAVAADATEVGDALSADRADVPDAPDAPPDLPAERPMNQNNGAVCMVAAQCKSKFCVDGFCCDSACEADDPNRCNACASAKTGQRDGMCAPDRNREKMVCGEACGQLAMNVPAVFAMVCQQGRCLVPAAPTVVGDPCRKQGDLCTTSFCDQPTARTARCVHTLCPQTGTCCCEQPNNAAARSCMPTTSCKNDRMCVSQ